MAVWQIKDPVLCEFRATKLFVGVSSQRAKMNEYPSAHCLPNGNLSTAAPFWGLYMTINKNQIDTILLEQRYFRIPDQMNGLWIL